jgi:hypothetical protein
MIPGEFYIVPFDPLAGDTVTANMGDHMEGLLNIWRYFGKDFNYNIYVSIGVF